MPAAPQPGMTFQQEFAPVSQRIERRSSAAGRRRCLPARFADTITVRDSNPLDGSRSTKVYSLMSG